MPTPVGRGAATVDRPSSPDEQNYVELVMMLRHTQGMFALMPVRSNYSVPERDALLRRLVADLGDIPLRIIRLNRESWNAAQLISDVAAELNERGAIAVLGLEETPGIVPAGGEENRRPVTLAVLNHGREAIRNRCRHPLIVWCDPLTYRTLREHAPDFFDYFTGLFSFEKPKDVDFGGPSYSQHQNIPEPKIADREPPSWLGSPTALAFYEEQVAKNQQPTTERARALLGLAETLWAHRGLELSARLHRAAQAATEALGILSKDDTPAEWARVQLLIGLILSARTDGDLRKGLHESIARFEVALQVYTETQFSVEWAKTQNRLGIAYANLGAGGRAENLLRAIACFEAASRVYTAAEFPRDWATIQNNLGNVYRILPTGDRTENVHRAIECFEAAFRIFTEAESPRDWAMTQYNLGLAYECATTSKRNECLRRAIACFEAALRVFTEPAFPDNWAMTQYSLGNAYRLLPSGDRAENVRRAITCFEAALRVYSEAEFPFERPAALDSLEAARRELDSLQLAPV